MFELNLTKPLELLQDAIHQIEQLLLLSTQNVVIMIVVVAAILLLFTIGVWHKRKFYSPVTIAMTSMTIPTVIAIFILSQLVYSGVPDENCHKYDNGNRAYSLVIIYTVPLDRSNPYGSKWLTLDVYAEQWGNETHHCRISLKNEKAKKLYDFFFGESKESKERNKNLFKGIGEFTFTFGGKFEQPNVTWKSDTPPPGKDVPPEAPPPED